MATVERGRAAAPEELPVENPATGAVIRTVPVTSADEVRALVARARDAQPAWQALGFEGRARVLRRAQKWVVDNSDRIVDTIVAETGKTHEDAQLAEITYAAGAFGFWAKHAPATWPTRRSAPPTRSWPAAGSPCGTSRSGSSA